MTTQSDARIDSALIALRRILRATELYERDLAQAAGLTPAKLRVLQILSSRDDGTATPTSLAQQMGVTQATVTVLVDHLQQLGLVSRQKSSEDRRQTHVVLSNDGTAALQSAPNALQQNFVTNFSGLEEWEQMMTVSVLERVATMLNAAQFEAEPVLAIGEISSGRAKR